MQYLVLSYKYLKPNNYVIFNFHKLASGPNIDTHCLFLTIYMKAAGEVRNIAFSLFSINSQTKSATFDFKFVLYLKGSLLRNISK